MALLTILNSQTFVGPMPDAESSPVNAAGHHQSRIRAAEPINIFGYQYLLIDPPDLISIIRPVL
jgi:hypothetical protein